MAQNITNADAILKDLYVGPIIEELNQKTFCLDQIERDSQHVDLTGRRAIVPVHKNRNRGRASIADGGTLPTPGQQQWLDAIVSIKTHTLGIELTDQSIQASSTNEGAFISLLEAETKGAAVDMRKDINRQVFGDGTGLLGTCGTTSSSTTVTMGNSYDMQYIKVGDVVDVLVKSSGATSTGVVGATVTARDVTNHTFTTASTVTTDNTFGVYISGNRNNEMDGLRNMASTGRTLHSIDSTAAGNVFWDSNVVNSGTSITATVVAGESLFEQLCDQVGQSGNGEVEVFLTTRGIKRRLADTYQSQKRFNDTAATQVHGGYSAIMVNEVPLIIDDDCPKTYAFALNRSALKWFEIGAPSWYELQNGGIFHLKVAGAGSFSSSWQAYMRWYATFGCTAPNRLGKLQFATDDNPATNVG